MNRYIILSNNAMEKNFTIEKKSIYLYLVGILY